MDSNEKVVLHEEELGRALTRIAHEIAERNPLEPVPAIVGIHRRGAFLAQRLHGLLEGLLDSDIPLGDLDIGFYRDDVASRPDAPILHASHIDFDIANQRRHHWLIDAFVARFLNDFGAKFGEYHRRRDDRVPVAENQ